MGGAADAGGRCELRRLLIFDMLAGAGRQQQHSSLPPSFSYLLLPQLALPPRRAQDAAFMEAAASTSTFAQPSSSLTGRSELQMKMHYFLFM